MDTTPSTIERNLLDYIDQELEHLDQVLMRIRSNAIGNEALARERALRTKIAEKRHSNRLHEESINPLSPYVVEVRPQSLECDVVRFQNKKERWVAFVGLYEGFPYEIFTGVLDDEDGIALPKTVTKGRIIKNVDEFGQKRYDFQFVNRRGYKTTIEGLSEKFDKEYWNYAKLISGVLRYRMPLTHVIKLVASLQLENENINTWKAGVAKALKKYIQDDEANVV